MRVLAVGAAGESAGLVVRALASAPVTVRGLVRSPERVDAARANGAAEVAVADLLDRASLEIALAAVDVVFHLVPAFAADEIAAGLTLVEEAIGAGVRRIIFSSVYHPSLLDLSNHQAKQPTEQAIYDSGLEFTVLQPAMFMAQLDGYIGPASSRGVITGPYSPRSKMSYVDYRDVAEVAARAVLSDDLLGGTFELAAPGEWSREDVARELTHLLGRDILASGELPETMPPDMPAPLAEGLMRMFRHYDESGFHGGNSLVLEALLRRMPMSVPRYLAERVRSDL